MSEQNPLSDEERQEMEWMSDRTESIKSFWSEEDLDAYDERV